MARISWTKELIIEKVEEKGYIFLGIIGKFKKRKTRIKVWCGNPNHKPYEVNFNNFLLGKCKKCSDEEKAIYTEEFIKDFVNNDEYSRFINFKEFKSSKSSIEVFCVIHNELYTTEFFRFKEGCRCQKCGNERRAISLLKWTEEKIINYIKKNSDDIFIEFIELNGQNSIIKLKCKEGHIREQKFANFLDNKRCLYCNSSIPLTLEYIKEKIKKDNYTLLSNEYKNNITPLEVLCDNGHIYKTNWNRYKEGKRCPRCYEAEHQSKGAKKIENILLLKNIDYKKEYRFEDCKFKHTLPFDFYLPQYNICIEFDGKQHYEIVDYFGGLDGFIDTKIRDTIKNIYCQQNNIKLIRIPYWDFDKIEEVLNKLNK